MALLPIAQIECAAPVGEPAHNESIRAYQLLAIDTEVLPRFERPLGDNQWPCDQWGNIFGPAVLDREFGEVNLIPFENNFLTRCLTHHLRPHIENLLENRQFFQRILKPFGWIWLFQIGHKLSYLSQSICVLMTHP